MSPGRRFLIAPLLLAAAVAAAWVWGTSAHQAVPGSGSSQPVSDEPIESPAGRYWFGSTGGTRDPVPALAKSTRPARKLQSIEGRVLAPDGGPLRGAEVSLTANRTEFIWFEHRGSDVCGGSCVDPDYVEHVHSMHFTARTGDDGRFLVEDISSDGREFWVSVLGTGSYAATPVVVKPTGSATQPQITIRTWSVGTLEIDVLAPDGDPVEFAEMRLDGGGESARLSRGSAGTSYQARVPVGRHAVTVTSPAGTAAPLHVDVPAGGAVRCTVRLEEGPTLAGTIVDAAGKPVWGALVSAFRAEDAADLGRAAVSRSDGTFRVTGLRPGQHRLVLAGNRFEPTAVGRFDAPSTGLRIPVPAAPRAR